MKCEDYKQYNVLCQTCDYPNKITCSKTVEENTKIQEEVVMDTYSFYEEELCMFFDWICYYSGRCAVCPKLAEYDTYCKEHPIGEVL